MEIVVQIAIKAIEKITILLILEVSRHHMIEIAPSGLYSITGGKWTTYRRMAQDIAAISVDLYLSIRNPFGKPDSHSKLMHYSIIIFCIVSTWILCMTDNFACREDMQICFIAAQNVDSRNVNTVAALPNTKTKMRETFSLTFFSFVFSPFLFLQSCFFQLLVLVSIFLFAAPFLCNKDDEESTIN